MRIVLVGGGTGGHFYPLIAIAEQIRAYDSTSGSDTELFYVGPEAYNQTELERCRIAFVYCPAGKQRTYRSWRNYVDLLKILAGIVVAFYKLLRLYPDVVMSKGGYTSMPIVLAAWLLRIPIVIHESDAVPGRANLFAARFARYIGIAHDDVAQYFPTDKVALVGMPIRTIFFNSTQAQGALAVPTDKPIIFITGGSSGAERINNLVLDALDELLPHYTVVHQCGSTHAKDVSEAAAALITDQSLLAHYFVVGNLDQTQMVAALKSASLIVSRAGSTTLFEIALLGKPAIVIPIPEDISRDQRTNAYAYARGGGAVVLEEHNLSDTLLVSEVDRIVTNPTVYNEMSAAAQNFTVGTAAATLANTLISIGKEHE